MTPTPPGTIPKFKQTPEVIFQPRTARGFQGGINTVVDAIRPSLGPFPRAVAVTREISANRSPELLDSGGVIARRIIELPDPDENVGAMYVRGALWNLHERVGDGVATAAILFQSIFNEGLKYIAAGGNAMVLRRNLEAGMAIIIRSLDELVVPISGEEALTGVAKTVCHDHDMAAALGKLISIIGEYGMLDIRAGHGRGIERELIAGSYWPGAIQSKKMIYDALQNRTVFESAAILVTDLEIEEPQELMPVIKAAVDAKISRLVIMCSKAAEQVQGLMFQSKSSEKLQMIAVKVPGLRSDVQMTNMIDMALLTGGKTLVKAAGDTLEGVTPEHFGFARRIWASEDYTGIVHPQGDPKDTRRHIDILRTAFQNAQNSEDRQRLQERIGKLLGGAAGIDVGGLTETEMDTRQQLAKRTADALRGAIRDGILPGGGTALLSCRKALDEMLEKDNSVDSRAAHRILNTALEAPFRALMANSGHSPGKILSKVERTGLSLGYDLVSEQVCEMIPNGILDVATVQKQAVVSAIRSASMALTIDVLVHRKSPPMVTDPDAPGI
jgi:chaperonin GroEL